MKFANGIIIQWGKQLIEGNYVTKFINFNQPYFSTVFMVTATPQRASGSGAGGTYTCHVLNSEITTKGFSIKSQIENGSGSQYIHWIAIGK